MPISRNSWEQGTVKSPVKRISERVAQFLQMHPKIAFTKRELVLYIKKDHEIKLRSIGSIDDASNEIFFDIGLMDIIDASINEAVELLLRNNEVMMKSCADERDDTWEYYIAKPSAHGHTRSLGYDYL